MQPLAPASEYVPAVHESEHAVDRPEAALYFPLAQLLQLVDPVAV